MNRFTCVSLFAIFMIHAMAAAQAQPPKAVPDIFTTSKDTALVVPTPGPLDNDFDPDGDPLSWISFSTPSSGTMSGASSNGAFTYTPNPGFSGLDELNYSITDGNGAVATSKLLIRVLETLPDPIFSDRFEKD